LATSDGVTIKFIATSGRPDPGAAVGLLLEQEELSVAELQQILEWANRAFSVISPN